MASNSFTAKAQEASMASAQEEWVKRLAEINLDEKTAAMVGLSLLTTTEMENEIGFTKGSGCIKIKYPGLDFYRYRFLGSFPGNKYFQHFGTAPQIYVPPNVQQTLDNVAIPLIITEGEFKAISCQEIPTIALGGVSSITVYHNNNRVLMEPLNSLLPNKQVYICFDYDPVPPFSGEPKEEVMNAELRLAEMLYLRGINVYFIRLGHPGLQIKVGLDDYLAQGNSIKVKMDYAKKFRPAKKDGLSYLLANYAVYQGDIIDIKNYDTYSFNKFSIQEANCANPYEEKDDKAPLPTKQFLMSPNRLAVSGIAFDINSPSYITKDYELNTWRGIKTQPHFGVVTKTELNKIVDKVEPWLEFLKLFFSEDPDIRPYFEECMALMLQKPWIKQQRICILMSKREGIGKSFFFETFAAIINDSPKGMPNGKFSHALVTSGGDLADDFNALVASKKMVVFNEIGEKGEKHTNLLKDLASSSSITAKEKYERAKSVPNYLQICITTNENFTHILGPDSRREVIYRVSPEGPLGDKLIKFFQENKNLRNWVNTPEARSALYDYYLNYDVGDYNGTQPAPTNMSKEMFAEATMHDAALYIRDELDDVNWVVPKLEFDRYIREGNSKLSKSAFIGFLRNAGYSNGTFDKAKSQLNFGKLTTNFQFQRPCVLCKPSHIHIENKEEVLEALNNRYFPGVKLL